MTAHVDTFARDNLPPRELWPEFLFDGPDLQFPAQLNCATELLDRRVAAGQGERLCIQGDGIRWTYADLQAEANRIARVLVEDLGLVPGNRVLLRGANSPQLAACWFGVIKAGGIAVGSMPLLRAMSPAPAPTTMRAARPRKIPPCDQPVSSLIGTTKTGIPQNVVAPIMKTLTKQM
jgi:2-aminobenzoate-CoA ligase